MAARGGAGGGGERPPPVVRPETIPKNVRDCQYAVRGELYLRAVELQKDGREIIYTNVGNPHMLGQPPITFNRLVLSLVFSPGLIDHPDVGKLFPTDVIARAKQYIAMLPGGVGAYSDSRGNAAIRSDVARYIKARDGPHVKVDPGQIFLTDGASAAVKQVLTLLIRGESDGIMVPVPQYPLYSASITLSGGTLVPYYLDEEKEWGLSMTELKASVDKARREGIEPRALVVINPGNPTGACLLREEIEEVCRFAYRERLCILADEVYQPNVYQSKRPFLSFKKVLAEMGGPESDSVELFSFHTVSKGYVGECGLRGGYVELTNCHDEANAMLYKMGSISLSPGLVGQVEMGLMVNPPQEGDPSYKRWCEERDGIMASLGRRAQLMADAFNSCEGITCNPTDGAMYSFPRVYLPKRAVDAAKRAGKAPDVFYCLRLLEATGISTVPGSGFGQKTGSFHFRTTILPPEDKFDRILKLFTDFHASFMDEYRDAPRSKL
mmetsp:Transcript_17847/g.62970  ORF Transcript_17847/g.62970 Transcript_17847/m.62970 type:complete len:495 (-) Transcript_17847:183-1667(-)|eukprot:CAMPEP_0203809364 /NCGR_PEP_ID=MMETSP0115-20131106/2231_1 /ASSEMBLY_ACC=CAM_ASM_000227 /TAXON_ID=33651 /ORGANISM="Bicosoecid sp, Strain ms1" /LENGTH=494 /DNA_ID=CAMNT_0050718091 /DNA_START=78 /DNA_END=1562 /DNA_ORIENTATION=-